jgi:hypothetical protein
MKIAFHCNQLSIRGTEVAMFDYAHFNEELLGNESIVLAKNPDVWPYSDSRAIEKFKNRFGDKVFFYRDKKEIENILGENKIDIFYAQKSGHNDGIFSLKRKSVIHAVFQDYEPHGNVYAFISEWLSKQYGNVPFVPYMVYLPDHDENLRQELGIPEKAVVYGRHGGFETFDIGFAKSAVLEAAKAKPDLYFLFMNTEKFSDDSYKNIIYLDPTADPEEKVKFINTCDAMLHARRKGETFGLAIAEFSIRNKPIITCREAYHDKAHFDLLGTTGIYYSTKEELYSLLVDHPFLNFDPKLEKYWNCYYNYTPEKVMDKFKSVFING